MELSFQCRRCSSPPGRNSVFRRRRVSSLEDSFQKRYRFSPLLAELWFWGDVEILPQGLKPVLEKGRVMDWNRFEGNWKQVKGNVKEKWGRLTDDDLDVINGRREQLEGKIQERYGIAKDQAKQDVEDWFKTLP
jgi:uncharacterized protein YjbJ (UPF0337 family)